MVNIYNNDFFLVFKIIIFTVTDSEPFQNSGSDYELEDEEYSTTSSERFSKRLKKNVENEKSVYSRTENSSIDSIVELSQSPIRVNVGVVSIIPTPDFSPHTPVLQKAVRESSFKKNILGKKRKSFPLQWKRTKEKLNFNAGKECKKRNGNIRKAKSVKKPCSFKCRLRCFENISTIQREEIFQKFWNLGDKIRQWQFILNNSKTLDKKTQTINAKNPRNCHRQYFFSFKNEENCVVEKRVCCEMFINTLDINKQVIQTAHNKLNSGLGAVSPDKRGRHVRALNHLSEQRKELIRNHINSIPLVDSHYCREKSSRKYMSQELNIKKLYLLFQEKLAEDQIKIEITERQYRDVFNNDFNIAFQMPQKDQCDVCTAFHNSEYSSGKSLLEHQKHLYRKDKARHLKEEGKTTAKESKGKILALVYDFEKQLNTPCGIESRSFYYFRQYLTYNFTIYDLATKDAYCYVWHESIGKKGANEVASCISHFLSTKDMRDVEEIYFYSDNCPSQNKNRIVFAFYAQIAKKFQINVNHIYLEKGHTQNEGDSVHSVIERAKKGKKIFVPSQWYSLIHCAKRTGNPYNVIEMEQRNFYNFRTIMEKFSWELNCSAEKVFYNQIRLLKILKDSPEIIRYKYEFEEDFKNINLLQKKGRKKPPSEALLLLIPEHLYSSQIPIPDLKFKDLKTMCEKKLIPEMYHDFYMNLKQASSNNIDYSSDEAE